MILTGLARIGRDAEIRYVPGSGDAICNISIAFNYGKKGEDGKRKSQWIDASLWGKRAEALAPYLLKGTSVDVVLSEPHIEAYEGKNGTGHKLVGRILEIELAGGGSAGASQAPAPKEERPTPAPSAAGASGFADMPDDFPF